MSTLENKTAFLRALLNARVCARPYRHWLLADALAPEVAMGLERWTHPAAEGATYTLGRREENNATRRYVNAETIAPFGPARSLAETFQDRETVSALEATCDIDLVDTYLRIEYAPRPHGVLAGAAYGHRGQGVHHVRLPGRDRAAGGLGNGHLCRSEDSCEAPRLCGQGGHDLCAGSRHVARLRTPCDERYATFADL